MIIHVPETCTRHNYITGWVDASRLDDTCRLVFCRVECQLGKSEQISFCLQIHHDFSWSVVLYQQQIEYSTSTVLNRFSLNLNSAAELCQVIQALESSIICQGNPDEKFALLYSYI